MDTSLFALSIDQWIVVTFLVATLIVGIVSGLKIKTVRDYTIGEKGSFPTSVIAITLIATMIGGNATAGTAAELFKHGYIYIYALSGYILGLLLLAKFVAARFDERFDGLISSADIIRKFYDDTKAEKFTSIVSAIFGVGVVSAQIIALASLAASFLNVTYEFAVLVSGGILVFYSAFGGIRSVAITDVIQFIILAVGIPIIANLCIQKIGGFAFAIQELPVKHTQIIQREDFWEYSMLFLSDLLPFTVLWPPLIQRYLMAKNSNQIIKITHLYIFLFISLLFMISCIAFTSVQLFPEVQPNAVIPNAIHNLLPIGLIGIAMAGMIAVIMSSADSFLNTAGIMLTLNTFFPDNASHSTKIRLMAVNTCIVGFIAIFIALQKISIFEIMVFC